MAAKIDIFDVVVVGGGIAGLLTAIELVGLGRSVLVVEQSDYTNLRAGEHISPRGLQILKHIGIPDHILKENSTPSQSVCFRWNAKDVQHSHYLCGPYGIAANITRPRFENRLADFAASMGVHILRQSRVRNFSRRDGWCFDIVGQRESSVVRARFAVDASGRSAFLSRLLGSRPSWQDRSVGILRYCPARSDSKSSDGALYVEACSIGWWGSAPLKDGRVAVTLLTDADLVQQRGGSEQVWRSMLSEASLTASRIYLSDLFDETHVAPAHSQVANCKAPQNWLPVGDASLAQDPLSGRGIEYAASSSLDVAAAVDAQLSNVGEGAEYFLENLKKNALSYEFQRRKVYRQVADKYKKEVFWRRRA